MEWTEANGVPLLRAELPGAVIAFSTRNGGVSEGAFKSLNIGILTEDDREAVMENRSRLSGAVGRGLAEVLVGRQVHGAEVLWHDGPQDPSPFAEPGPGIPEVDGHATACSGVAALVFVADCLPIALRGPEGVAMVHGGWRGLAGGIVARAAEMVGATHAAIGPGIGPCCYEVGEEVLAAFGGLGPDIANGRMLDLPAVAGALLEAAGVSTVESAGLCTYCNPDVFFSHRRDGGRTGRQTGLAWLEGSP